MTENDVLRHVFDRLGESGAGEAIFGADEVRDWPSGVLDALVECALLALAQPAGAIGCPGCEEDCIMPVHVVPAEAGRPAQVFIACDKRDDVGRVPVEMRRLDQWYVSGELVAHAVARQLACPHSPKEDAKGKRWVLGLLKTTRYKAYVTLAVERGVAVELAGHAVPLAEVLTLREGSLTVDRKELTRLAKRPLVLPGTPGYTPSVARQEERKQKTLERHQAWQEAYRNLKHEHPDKPDTWYARKIAKMAVAKGAKAETIRKHMKSGT